MTQYRVIVPKLNVRKAPVADVKDKSNIITTVNEGLVLELEEFVDVPNPGLGKWYRDKQNQYYWGGGLMALGVVPAVKVSLTGLPKNLPENFQQGVDVSHHNAQPDWDAFVKSGVSFVYIKISEGVGTADNKAFENATNASTRGLKIGYYHFCRPDTRNGGTIISDAKAEATEALRIMNGLPKSNLPLVLDLENQSSWDTPLKPQEYVTWIRTFVDTIQTAIGLLPMIYSRKEYLDRKLPKNHGFSDLKLWVSYYPKSPDCSKVTIPNGWQDWSIWQYTEVGAIGTNPKLDLNILKDDTLFINT